MATTQKRDYYEVLEVTREVTSEQVKSAYRKAAMQWHPEWKITENPDSMKLLAAFGEACRQYQLQKQRRGT